MNSGYESEVFFLEGPIVVLLLRLWDLEVSKSAYIICIYSLCVYLTISFLIRSQGRNNFIASDEGHTAQQRQIFQSGEQFQLKIVLNWLKWPAPFWLSSSL